MSQFTIGVNINKLQPPNDGAAYLWLPNDTQINLAGDPTIIKQILERLDGLVISYGEQNHE